MAFKDKPRINQINWPISDALHEAIELFRVIENVNHLTCSLELENLKLNSDETTEILNKLQSFTQEEDVQIIH